MIATPGEDHEATHEPEIADATNAPEIADGETEIASEMWQRHVNCFAIRLDRDGIVISPRDLFLFLQWAFPQWQEAAVGTCTDLMHLFLLVRPYHR